MANHLRTQPESFESLPPSTFLAVASAGPRTDESQLFTSAHGRPRWNEVRFAEKWYDEYIFCAKRIVPLLCLSAWGISQRAGARGHVKCASAVCAVSARSAESLHMGSNHDVRCSASLKNRRLRDIPLNLLDYASIDLHTECCYEYPGDNTFEVSLQWSDVPSDPPLRRVMVLKCSNALGNTGRLVGYRREALGSHLRCMRCIVTAEK